MRDLSFHRSTEKKNTLPISFRGREFFLAATRDFTFRRYAEKNMDSQFFSRK